MCTILDTALPQLYNNKDTGRESTHRRIQCNAAGAHCPDAEPIGCLSLACGKHCPSHKCEHDPKHTRERCHDARRGRETLLTACRGVISVIGQSHFIYFLLLFRDILGLSEGRSQQKFRLKRKCDASRPWARARTPSCTLARCPHHLCNGAIDFHFG